MKPNLDEMLAAADAALLIGDPALHVDPYSLPYPSWDLGEEWTRMTRAPMVFAVWAGRAAFECRRFEPAFTASCRFGFAAIDEIIRMESASRKLPEPLVRSYLTRHIRNELGENEYKGLDLFLELASKLGARVVPA
jgi:predicted solute-binding protein